MNSPSMVKCCPWCGRGAGFRRGSRCPTARGRGDELGGPGVRGPPFERIRELGEVGPVEIAAAPEVLPGEGVGGGDDVPGGPAVAEVVEGGEPAGQFVRLVEGRVDGGGEAEPVGDGGQSAQHREGLGSADHVQIVDAPLVLAQPQPLREEEEVEPAALRRAGEVLEGGEVDLALRAGVGPDGGVVHAGEVGGEVHLLPRRCGHDRPSARAYRFAGRASPRCSRSVPPG